VVFQSSIVVKGGRVKSDAVIHTTMIESFELNSDAINYFNTKAEELLYLLKPLKNKERERKVDSSLSHTYSEIIDDEKIISFGNLKMQDGFGNVLARFFHYEKTQIGLDNEDYRNYLKFTEQLLKKNIIRKFLSPDFVEDVSFKWFEKRYKGEIKQETGFITFFESESRNCIKNYKISIPLSYVSIQEPFVLGKVQYEFLKKDFFDEMLSHHFEKLHKSLSKEEIEKSIFKLRKEYQGNVFATFNIEAEKEKAIEIALETIDIHIKLFKCFSPTAFIPEIPSYFNRKGQTNIPQTYIFLYETNFPNIISSVDEKSDFLFRIDNKTIEEFSKLKYSQAFDIVLKENASDFENTFFNIVSLFSKSISSITFQDKLIYSLVALEVLLLKNETEPIQHSIGIRLAFLNRKNIEDRKKVIKLVKDAYKLRSSYIHHGKIKTQNVLLQELQHLVWQSIINVIRSIDKFKSQSDFVNYIEDLILS
jgi:hypothetical protein